MKVCSGFGEQVCQFITGESIITETHWKLRATRDERESKRTQISQKDFSWRNLGAVERKASAKWESVGKRPIKSGVLRWEWHHSKSGINAKDSAEKLQDIGVVE